MSKLFIVALLCGLTAACSSSPDAAPQRISGREVILQVMPIACAKLRDCNAYDFENTFPGGIDDCVDDTMSKFPQRSLTSKSACTQDQIDICIRDQAMLKCPASGPAESCTKC